MRGRIFNWKLSGASVIGVLIGAFFVSTQREVIADNTGGRVLWMGLFFLITFVCGFIGLQVAMRISKLYTFQRHEKWWLNFLIASVLVFAVSTSGQYAFMYSKTSVTTTSDVDMVLLLDASASMDTFGYDDIRTEAACKFVDSLDDSCRLEAVSFAAKVLETTQLLDMDSSGKQTVKDMISDIDALGLTDFNEPFQEAKTILTTQGRPNCNKAVILLTDGQGYLNSGLKDDYINSGIKVFTVRISDSDDLDESSKALADFAKSTNGFDEQLIPDANGNIDTTQMLNAFQNAFDSVSRGRVEMREDFIIYADDGITVMQFFIRLLVMSLCSIIIGIGYFSCFDFAYIVSGAIVGSGAAVAVTAFENAGYLLAAVLTCIFVVAAWVFINKRGEDYYDV